MFSLYPEEPNYITFLLTRDDAGTIDGGVFTIGNTLIPFRELQFDLVTQAKLFRTYRMYCQPQNFQWSGPKLEPGSRSWME